MLVTTFSQLEFLQSWFNSPTLLSVLLCGMAQKYFCWFGSDSTGLDAEKLLEVLVLTFCMAVASVLVCAMESMTLFHLAMEAVLVPGHALNLNLDNRVAIYMSIYSRHPSQPTSLNRFDRSADVEGGSCFFCKPFRCYSLYSGPIMLQALVLAKCALYAHAPKSLQQIGCPK